MIKFFTFMMILISARAFAQMDPSSFSMDTSSSVNSVGSANVDDFESSRYIKKPKAERRRRRKIASDQTTMVVVPAASPTPATDLKNSQVSPLPSLAGETFNSEAAPAPEFKGDPANPTFGNKMRDLLLGGELEQMDRYRSFLDSEDIRKNLFEFTVASTYMYNTSMSSSYFRNYIDSGPGVFMGVNIWLTPFLGIDADYRTTLLNELRDSPNRDTYVTSTHTWFDLGLKFRRFFGIALNSPSLAVGLKYADYTLDVPPSAQTRLRQHTQGPSLTFDVTVPAGKSYSWLLGLVAQPYLTHNELVGGTDVRAGTSNQTAAFGASLGGEYRMTRQTRAFYKFSTMVYKSQFSGQTPTVDPVSGLTATGVPVNNFFYFLDLGITLGR